MKGYIRDLVPLVRKHFDFLVTDRGFQCVRTWNEFMSRYQGVEYRSAQATVLVEQEDSPIFGVRLTDARSDGWASLTLEEIVRDAAPEVWSHFPQGHAWPRPIEQDEEQLRFLSECTRRFCGAWLWPATGVDTLGGA